MTQRLVRSLCKDDTKILQCSISCISSYKGCLAKASCGIWKGYPRPMPRKEEIRKTRGGKAYTQAFKKLINSERVNNSHWGREPAVYNEPQKWEEGKKQLEEHTSQNTWSLGTTYEKQEDFKKRTSVGKHRRPGTGKEGTVTKRLMNWRELLDMEHSFEKT